MVVNFNDYIYERPDLETLPKEVNSLLTAFNKADSAEEQSNVVDKLNDKFNTLDTMATLAVIRSSIDTKDEYYDAERKFFDENYPKITEIQNKYYASLVNSLYRPTLENQYGSQLFALAENQLKSYDTSVSSLVQEENRLTTEYSKLLASAEIEFDGKVLNLAEFGPYAEHPDRNIRKNASLAAQSFMNEHSGKMDEIYDKLVKTRHKIAKSLGYKNFIKLGYIRMNRIDYDREMVENFRKQVAEYIVPVVSKLKEQQRQRIGVPSLKSYDESFDFIDGNATPKGDTKEIIESGAKMYKELSKETNEFYTFMISHDLFDVEAKKGKEGGGYCTFIPDYHSPFIFSNFNGTLEDVSVLTHEAGHAFQSYMSSHFDVPEYQFPTLESAEIHSMSMEYFTYPWMHLFFGDQTDKFKYTHLADNLSFLPYGVAIDEFQHIIYENPDLTPKERRNEWRKLENKYLPHRDYDGIEPLESGAFWHRQHHVFSSPFYYIDYTLAQVCALQFWSRAAEDFDKAWADYIELCKLGGSLPFRSLIEKANLNSPFEEGSLKSIIDKVSHYLDSIDDSKL